MKTKIIILETHDDLISVRDKLSWAKTPRILLVWPKYEKVTLRLLDLKVLQRHADSLGAQLGLVTRRAKVRRDAESLRIPVFNSTTSAQKDPWPEPVPRTQRIPKPPRPALRQMRDSIYEKEPVWRTSLLGRVVTFTAGVIAVLAVAGLFVPRAAVTLYPESQTRSIVIPVNASPSFETVSVTGNIPAQTLSVLVDAEGSLAVTSKITLPKSKSKGVARFTNLGSDEIEIPAGTILSTLDLIRFVTLNDTRLPTGIDKFVEVPIEALKAGSQGNVESDSILIVEGTLGLSVKVTNPDVISGGTDIKTIGATEGDRAELRVVVLEKLRRSAEMQMRAQIEVEDLLLPDTIEITETLREEFSPSDGQAGTMLVLKMQVEYSARSISYADLKQLAVSTSSAGGAVPQGFFPFGEVTFKPLSDPITDSIGVTHFELEATQVTLRDIDEVKVFSIIRGHDPVRAQTELMKSFALRDEPQITIRPAWWKRLPLIPFNILVELK
ncbi:MAG TPA: baseplate J/gp47 family protein [Anaerolineales bacterium]|nr:baseplate J/gp47 family protein [Anaerolineales bacterium]